MLSAANRYDSVSPPTDCERLGTRIVPLMRENEQVGTIPLMQPHFIDYAGSMSGKLVVHGEITGDGILWDDEQD